MTPAEIKEKIDANNLMIETLFDPSKFVLNKAVQELMLENAKLQEQCPHIFENGKCIFCYKGENN